MSSMKKILATLVASVSLTWAASAAADGLMAAPSDLPEAARSKLEAQIADYKQKHPEVFDAVRNVKGIRPENYGKQRNPVPLAGRELRHLKKKALLPMLEALAFDAPVRGSLADHEWRALKVGMLEAVGVLRDRRARPVLFAAFDNAAHPVEQEAAGEAIGRLCDDASLAKLDGALAGQKRNAAIAGLGQCRRVEAVQELADLLDAASDPTEAARIAEALGMLGSSWAWRALGADRAAEGLEVRRIAAAALVRGFVRFGGEARKSHSEGLTMVELPELRTVAAVERAGADAAAEQELDELVARLEARMARR
jgi:hypothetical protein